MHFSNLSVNLVAVLSAWLARVEGAAVPRWGWQGQCRAKTAYFMTNNGNNAIIAIDVADDGTLSQVASTTPTGGLGAATINGMNNMPAGPDALSSQGSLEVSGNFLFAVNPGSNTLSTFWIDPKCPSDLKLLGEPVWTGGDFPVSVCASPELQIVCVANTGANAGVSCANFGSGGTGAFDSIRPIYLHQTNPPVGPTNGIAQVLFSEDMSEVLTIVKGNGTAADPSLAITYAVDSGTRSVSSSGVSVSPAGSAVLFGTVPIPGTTHLLASDAGFGALLLDIDDLAAPLALTNITDQKATCWAVYSAVTGTGFVDDVGLSQLTEIDLSTGEIIGEYPNNNNGQGMIDLAAVGDKIYALSPGNGSLPAAVTVFDVSGGRGTAHTVQNFLVDSAGKDAEGMGVYLDCSSGWSRGHF